MAKPESGLPERVAALETEAAHLTRDINALTVLRDRLSGLEGRLNERDRVENLFWSKYGVYATITSGIVGAVAGIVIALAAVGKL
jgi:flagellar motor component MotA